MIKLKHSKYKNTGFIYQILVRNVSTDIMQGRQNSPSLKILKRHFKNGTQLNEQLMLYNILLNNKMTKWQHAEMLVVQTLKLYDRIKIKELNKQKYNLIQQIKKNYNIQDLFKTRIQQYRTLASIYKLFESRNTSQLYNPIDTVNARKIVLQNIISNTSIMKQRDQIVQNFINEDQETQILAYKLIIQRFNKKYNTILNQDQKQLLRKYLHSFSDVTELKEHIQKILPVMSQNLKKKIQIISDNVIKIKLYEILNQLNGILPIKLIKQSQVIAILKTYSLLQQLQEIQN